MTINILDEKWITVRKGGEIATISPYQVCNEDVEELADFREDFNIATMTFLISLVQSTIYEDVKCIEEQEDSLCCPMKESDFRKKLEEFHDCFFLVNNEKPDTLFFQGSMPEKKGSRRGESEEKSIDKLFPIHASENAIKKGKTIFAKEKLNPVACVSCTIKGLIFRQTNAPFGGGGNCTSSRGAQPLTVLLINKNFNLWQNILLNVARKENTEKEPKANIFPWYENSFYRDGVSKDLTPLWYVPRPMLLQPPTCTQVDCTICGETTRKTFSAFCRTDRASHVADWKNFTRHPLALYDKDRGSIILPRELGTYGELATVLKNTQELIDRKLSEKYININAGMFQLELDYFGYLYDGASPRMMSSCRIPLGELERTKRIVLFFLKLSTTLAKNLRKCFFPILLEKRFFDKTEEIFKFLVKEQENKEFVREYLEKAVIVAKQITDFVVEESFYGVVQPKAFGWVKDRVKTHQILDRVLSKTLKDFVPH